MKPVLLVFLLLVTAAMAGCDESPVAPSALREITWKLESIERAGAALQTVSNPEQFTLRLENDGRAGIRADCNSCSGRYTLDGSSFSLTPLACTRAFCGVASLDSSYTAALQDAQTAVASQTQLVLRGNGVTLRFRN